MGASESVEAAIKRLTDQIAAGMVQYLGQLCRSITVTPEARETAATILAEYGYTLEVAQPDNWAETWTSHILSSPPEGAQVAVLHTRVHQDDMS